MTNIIELFPFWKRLKEHPKNETELERLVSRREELVKACGEYKHAPIFMQRELRHVTAEIIQHEVRNARAA